MPSKNYFCLKPHAITVTQLIGLLLVSYLYAANVFSEQAISKHSQLKTEIDFINEMQQQHHFNPRLIRSLLNQAVHKQKILAIMDRPSEAKPWYQYRKLFVTNTRVKQGVGFYKKNQAVLQQVSQYYGVPAEIIVAIIGVETSYGRNTGSFRVWDILTTLAFNYPRRADFFRQELINFLLLCREENINPLEPKGSYAGAMGIGQFMPSSYRHYAVDFNRDNKRDLWQTEDAIASVANYLKQHGWQTQQAIIDAAPAPATEQQAKTLLALGLEPKQAINTLLPLGLQMSPAWLKNHDQHDASIIRLKTEMGWAYWLSYRNFYVITRYNHSRRYAMVIYQLAELIKHHLLTD